MAQQETPWENLLKKGGTEARLDALGWTETLFIAYVNVHAVKSDGEAITDLMDAAKVADENGMPYGFRPAFQIKKVRIINVQYSCPRHSSRHNTCRATRLGE